MENENFGLKKICAEKEKFRGEENFRARKILGREKMLAEKFQTKKIWKIEDENFGLKKNLRRKIIFDQEKFGGEENFRARKKIGRKILDQENLEN